MHPRCCRITLLSHQLYCTTLRRGPAFVRSAPLLARPRPDVYFADVDSPTVVSLTVVFAQGGEEVRRRGGLAAASPLYRHELPVALMHPAAQEIDNDHDDCRSSRNGNKSVPGHI
eukprot:scaffold92373_cov50-Phaeocystis_antarctica.AAC.1